MPRLVVEEGEASGREIQLAGRIVLGREGEWALPDSKMSRQHVRIFKDEDGWSLADLNSRNGTQVNGAKVTTHTLSHGDRIQVGNTVLRFLDESHAVVEPATVAAAALPKPATAQKKTTPAPKTATAPAAKGAGFIVYAAETRGAGGPLFEDISQRNFAYKAGLVVLALAAAFVLFWVVTIASEKLFD